MAEAKDCLIAALGGYIQERRKIPRSSPARGRPLVALPALVAAKTALYSEMRVQGIGNTVLAKQLGITEGAVRRLIDPDHRSHIGQVETALGALGQRLVGPRKWLDWARRDPAGGANGRRDRQTWAERP